MKLRSLILGLGLSLIITSVSFGQSSTNPMMNEYLKATEQLKIGNFHNASLIYSNLCKQGFEGGCNMLPLSLFPINEDESIKLAEERVSYYQSSDPLRSAQLCITYISFYHKYTTKISWFLRYLNQYIKSN